VEALPTMSVGSIFYHFVDARRREPVGKDDFSAWLAGIGSEHSSLVESLATVDPYFESLFVIRDRLSQVLGEHFGASGDCEGSAGSRRRER
jgi:hypothetical protein